MHIGWTLECAGQTKIEECHHRQGLAREPYQQYLTILRTVTAQSDHSSNIFIEQGME